MVSEVLGQILAPEVPEYIKIYSEGIKKSVVWVLEESSFMVYVREL